MTAIAAVAAFLLTRALLPPLVRLLAERGALAANHRGHRIPVGAGLAPALATALVGLAAGGSAGPSFAAGVLGFALVGLVDDLLGDRTTGGLRGHLGALLAGRLTTGAVKALVGFGVAAAVALAAGGGILRVAVATLVMALAANAVNLFDLRPGRALKVVLLVGLVAFVAAPAAVTADLLGAAAGAWPEDVAGRAMLGDVGANALGFGLGFALARLPSQGAVVALLALVALHAYTERSSLSQAIERVAWLRYLDRLGRRDG
jgi:UDP-GlcNAc:undecaprenyl-phosphate GlcNAc-1-phosphate transferase